MTEERPPRRSPLRIGLTGGIAAGKSVAAERLRELGAAVVDYDRLARDVVEPGSVGLTAVAGAFGPEVLTADGALDRAALAARVFADDEARATLDALVHPLVRQAAETAEAAARSAGAEVVVHDIPLLVETGDPAAFDQVVVVHAPAEQRRRRLVEGRGLTEADARGRLAAQAGDEERIAEADVVLDGSGAVEDLRGQVDALWERWMAHLAARTADGTAVEAGRAGR